MDRSVAAGTIALLLCIGTAHAAGHKWAAKYDVEEKSIDSLAADLAAGHVTSEELVAAYLDRIAKIDRVGPTLQSVIAINLDAITQARALDAERREKGPRGPLHGIPILVKDNIETADAMPTTAGSLALKDNFTRRDAFAIARLRAAGAIVLGKTNLSEWANIRSNYSISGWSAVGGLVRNPYALDRNACGSSSGSGAAVAASLAAAALGTETDGSIVCPAAVNGVVGLKPTVGLISRAHIVPISHSQDTPGPMGRSVADVAILLTAMAGSDAADPATAAADDHKQDYTAGLASASLVGKRLGVLRLSSTPATDAVFAQALGSMRNAGAVIMEMSDFKPATELGDMEMKVLMTELKVDLNDYLATTPQRVSVRTLEDAVAFNIGHPREMALFGQDLFEKAEKTAGLSDHEYLRARKLSLREAGIQGIDQLLTDRHLDALVMPTVAPAWRSDAVRGDNALGDSSTLPAIAGYPHLTVPMGYVRGLPVGISFIGTAWSEAQLLELGAAFEQVTQARRKPTYPPSIEAEVDVAAALTSIKN